MKNLLRLFLLFLVTIPIVGQTVKSPAKSDTSANTKFSEMEDRFVKDSLVLSPVSASQAGYHKHLDAKTGRTILLDAELDDVGPAAISTQQKFYRDWRARFRAETPITSLNRAQMM